MSTVEQYNALSSCQCYKLLLHTGGGLTVISCRYYEEVLHTAPHERDLNYPFKVSYLSAHIIKLKWFTMCLYRVESSVLL